MSKEIQKTQDLTPEQIEVLAQAQVIPQGTPPAVVSVFATACREHGLSPFKKEIYLVKYDTKRGPIYATIVGIDGPRIKAARTGQYAGIEDPKFDLDAAGNFKTASQVKASGKAPITCTITVYRMIAGQRCPFTHTCVYDEFAPAQGGFSKWATMPFQMIAKCTESFATKKAFGDETSGLHIEEEQAAFEDTQITAAAAKPEIVVDVELLKDEIQNRFSVESLLNLYNSNSTYKSFAYLFTERKAEIEILIANGQIQQ